MKRIRVDIWSDCVCPYCYAGKRHLEMALLRFPFRESVEVIWHSYQLNPQLTKDNQIKYYDFLSQSFGISPEDTRKRAAGIVSKAASVGLEYNLEKAVQFNTFEAHRVIQKAKERGLGGEAEEAIFKAFFIDGVNLNNTEEIIRCGVSAGLTPEDCREALTSERYYNLIWEDFREAESRSIELVPTFFFSGGIKIEACPDVETFLDALNKSYELTDS